MPSGSIGPRQSPDSNRAERRSIPRFASFKPNTPSKTQGQEIENSSVLHENLSKSFVVDRIGDFNNLKFGDLHRYARASYFRFGSGIVVGSPSSQRIDRAVSTDKGLVLSDDTHGLPKNKGRHERWTLDQERVGVLKAKLREEHELGFDSDFVSLEAPRRVKRRRGNDGSMVDCVSSSDESVTHYRSEQGKAKSKTEPADQDLKFNSGTLSSQDIESGRHVALDEWGQTKRVRLSKRIDVNPTSFEAWMDLISHQEKMLGLGQDFRRKSVTNAERRSNTEIKLSMFEKALEKVKDSRGRGVLLIGMMQEAVSVWEPSKISSHWKNILQQNPQSLQLWIKYLDFMQTSFTSFRFGEVQSAYLNCLNKLQGARNRGEPSLDDRDKIFDIQIHIVLRMTCFMRETGFAEHATAAWQALLEFVFFKPIMVQASGRNKDFFSDEASVSIFENFWDSEVPRIGEDGAEGWASFHHKQGKPPQPRTETADDLKDSKNHWKLWLASERRHSWLSRNPARTIDDIEENDPYRIIMFSDIRPFLIDSPSLAGQQLILDAFLVFCHLPPFAAEGPDSHSRGWGRDGFIRNDALWLSNKLQDSWKLRFSRLHGCSVKSDSVDKQDNLWQSGVHDPFQFPLLDHQVSADSLFTKTEWFSAFNTWQEPGDGGPVEVAWVLRSLKSLLGVGVREEAVTLHALALELWTSPGTVKKTAKNFLRKRPFSIPLYNAYALVEYRLGDVEKGESIITTSINMGKNLDEASQRDAILLWRTWIWETLSAKSAQEALVRLLAIGDGEVHTPSSELHLLDYLDSAKPALLLRTERAFVAIRDHMLSLRSYRQAAFAIECLILFAYLRNGLSSRTATSAFKSNIQILSTYISSSSSDHEYLHQSFARLLYYHATHTHIYKPSEIRSLLAETIAQFPQNTIFLSLYAWNEARFRIDDRLRSVVKELVLSGSGEPGKKAQGSVMPHFFAIYSELHRAVTLGSNAFTIRSTFERAVESDSGAHCAGLWKLYFLFEFSRYETERANMVFWRSLKACPWAKDLYMLAFEYLRDEVMDEAGLRGIYELLGQKELRVHVGLEDVLRGDRQSREDERKPSSRKDVTPMR